MTHTPADELRAAAQKLRATAGNSTEGAWAIWRDLDHQGYITVGNAAGVITPPALQSAGGECNPVAHVYVEEDAEYIALMHPGVGLALADWLDETARYAALYADLYTASTGAAPTEYDSLTTAALVVARRVLGETTTNTGAQADGFDKTQSPSYQGYLRQADAVMAVLPTGADLEPQDHPGADLFVALRAAGLDTDEANRRMYAYAGMVLRQDKAISAPPAPADRAAFEALATEWEKRGEYGDSGITDRARELRDVLADEAQQPTGSEPVDTIGLCADCGNPQEGHHHGYERTPHLADAQQPAPAVTEEPTPVVTIHACPGPYDNGMSPCCHRPPFEFRGERLTRDLALVTCPGTPDHATEEPK